MNVVTGPNREPLEMPFLTFQKGAYAVPEEGDTVQVSTVNGERVAHTPVSAPAFTFPTDLTEGDFCFKFNEDTELHFSKQTDGTVNVELSADGDVSITTTNGGNVNVQSDGDTTVESTGDVTVNGSSITLGADGGAESLAVQSHTHEYEDTGDTDAGGSSPSTKTTSTPIEDGTQKTKAE
ncbi:hypothetical protein JMJ58_19240 [Haloterrigena salifodinae]|uniref:Gp5/Type VI secretion system Vgr protein OB-fold domain-containing protein n=1 Tax=Haloterrigena salifodinae TaxID=2675099 RepID=A0A8T8DZK3_9EURY|nr:hypothetical protein [Haloterrigena salifodinae]QRV15018.1 hypothetical protein JMJ58_19240 [Haloterrigena salifodinae]